MNCFCCRRSSHKTIPAIAGERDYDHTTSSQIGCEDESVANPLSSCPNTKNETDLISYLPNDILIKIMSSLSTKDAIKTSTLCSRWINIWKDVNNVQINYRDILNFLDGCSSPEWILDSKLCAVTEGIQKLLSAINYANKVFKLEITKISKRTLRSHDLVDSVAKFCLDHHVEYVVLDFDFPGLKFLHERSCKAGLQIGTFLPIRSLTSLFVNGCTIQLSSLERSLYPSFLKTLVLCKVDISKEEVEDLICKCPSLTSLFLHSYRLILGNNIIAINHPKLRSLVIQVYAPIKLRTPALKLLEFPDLHYSWGRIPPQGHIFEDVSSLRKCKFQFSREIEQSDSELLWSSLYSLRHVKTIQLDHNCIKGLPLSAPPITTLPALTTRKLQLSLEDAGDDVKSIARSLAFFSRIEKLTMFMEGDRCPLHSRKYWWRRLHSWRLLKQSLSGMEQLKEVSLHNFFRAIDKKATFTGELKMVQSMMQSIKNLEKLTVHVSRDRVRRAPTSFISKLLNRFDRIRVLPRASPIATLDIVYASYV